MIQITQCIYVTLHQLLAILWYTFIAICAVNYALSKGNATFFSQIINVLTLNFREITLIDIYYPLKHLYLWHRKITFLFGNCCSRWMQQTTIRRKSVTEVRLIIHCFDIRRIRNLRIGRIYFKNKE